jgi:hypothetical protein
MSCPLLFHHYTYFKRFWDYPKWGYNSKFGSTLIMSPLLLSYKSSFPFQNVGQSHDALCMCKIARDSITCIVKLMDDLNIFCKMYLGNQPIFHISLLQLENYKITHLYGLQFFIQFIKISMVLVRLMFEMIWRRKICPIEQQQFIKQIHTLRTFWCHHVLIHKTNSQAKSIRCHRLLINKTNSQAKSIACHCHVLFITFKIFVGVGCGWFVHGWSTSWFGRSGHCQWGSHNWWTSFQIPK